LQENKTLPPIPRYKTKPWRHQVEAYHAIKDFDAALLYMGMGTGKSRCVIDQIANDDTMKLVLIVCPLAVISAWEHQFAVHCPVRYEFVVLRGGSTVDNVKILRENLLRQEARDGGRRPLQVFCINYESVWRSMFGNYILTLKWDMIVSDEIQKLKSPGSKVSRFMARLGKTARRRLGLSGTPLAHSPMDAYAEFRFLNPLIFGTSFIRFRSRYAVMGGYGGYQVLSYKNQKDFSTRFYSITYRADSSVLDLPDVQHIKVPIELSNDRKDMSRQVYQSLEREFVAAVKSGVVTVSNALVKLLRLQQITSGFLRVDDSSDQAIYERLNSNKEKALAELLETADKEPVVVFCRFREDLNAVHRAAQAAGCSSLELSGTRKELERWQAGEAQVLAVQISSGAEGITLVRARIAIYYSLSFSLSQYEQSLARIHRPGQGRKVLYYHLITLKTVDEKLYRALRQRKKVIEELLADYGGMDAAKRINMGVQIQKERENIKMRWRARQTELAREQRRWEELEALEAAKREKLERGESIEVKIPRWERRAASKGVSVGETYAKALKYGIE